MTARGRTDPAAQAEALRAAAKLVVFETEAERAADEHLDQAAAARFLGVGPAVLSALLASGLVPVVDTPAGPALAYHDAAALGLHGGLGSSVPELGLSMMMRFARQADDALLARLDWSFRVKCPRLPAAGARLRVPGAGAVITAGPAGGGSGDDGWPLPGGEGEPSVLDGSITTRGSAAGFGTGGPTRSTTRCSTT